MNDTLNQIRNTSVVDVAVRLKISIKGHKAYCFSGHDRKTPSLSFEPRRNIWTCFGCGKRGDNIQLVMETLQCSFKEAISWFKAQYGFEVGISRNNSPRPKKLKKLSSLYGNPTDQPISNCQSVQTYFSADSLLYSWLIKKCDSVKATQGVQYLKNHGITQDVAECFFIRELRDPSRAIRELMNEWGVERIMRSGIAWGNHVEKPLKLIWPSYALLFPFIEKNNVIYIQGRLFLGNKKYVNPRGIQKPLYNHENMNKLPRGSTVHICEGITDAIALESAGFSAVSTLGATSFRSEWVNDFLRHNIVIVPDGDAGGKTFAEAIKAIFRKKGKSIRSITAPAGQDVASVVAWIRRGKGNE